MNSKVNLYLVEGCGRCSLYRTPQCKVHNWTEELSQLRQIVLDSELQEKFKWSQPCYTFQGKNVLMLTAFKEFATISFFKGALLNDSNKILVAPGPNSQSTRQIRFTNVRDIKEMEAVLKTYIFEAIEMEKTGLKVQFKQNPEPIPAELQKKLAADTVFNTAFKALTKGRQRAYILYFSAPKQSKTREERIKKCTEKILSGQGINDAYKSMKK